MKRAIFPIAALALAAIAGAALLGTRATTEAAPADGQVIPGQYVVLTARGVDVDEVLADHGLNARHVYSAALSGFAGAVPDHILAALKADSRVVAVEPERIYRLADLPTGVDRVEADKIHGTVGVGTVPIDVAVIDTGIDASHPDLNVVSGISFSDNSSGEDKNGHGTHVAGTVGANGTVVGVAPGARLHAVKVCKNGGLCFTGDIAAGIDWVADQKAAYKAGSGGTNFAVATMSISTSDDANPCTGSSGAVHEAICGLVGEGVVFTLAAGNDGRVKSAYPEALAVSALADFDGRGGGDGSTTCRSDEDETLANFSNWGSTVDIAAPGVCILSTWTGGGYNTISGTSMATPHVAGAAALYLHLSGTSPATDAAGVDAIEQAILSAALPEGTSNHACSYDNERGSHEPLLFVNGSAFGGDGSCDVGGTVADAPPNASIANPTDGSTVSGVVTIQVDASDAEDDANLGVGTLIVEVSIDGGAYQAATYNGTTGYYELDWDSTAVGDGASTIDTRATDDAGQTTNAPQITVIVDNVDDPPSATIVNPPDGSTVGGTITVQVDASDDRDAEGSLDVAVSIDGTYAAATYNAASGYYEFDWDTTGLTDGTLHTVDARATDSGTNTADAAQVSVTVDNSVPAIGASLSYSWPGGSQFELTATITNSGSSDASVTVVWLYEGAEFARDEPVVVPADGGEVSLSQTRHKRTKGLYEVEIYEGGVLVASAQVTVS